MDSLSLRANISLITRKNRVLIPGSPSSLEILSADLDPVRHEIDQPGLVESTFFAPSGGPVSDIPLTNRGWCDLAESRKLSDS